MSGVFPSGDIDLIESIDRNDLLSAEEDMFALAVIQYGGNLSAAYKEAYGPSPTAAAQARILMLKPAVIRRIRDLNSSVHQSDLITIESHLVELAIIRDMAKHQGMLKVALNAEESRGKVIGLYVGKGDNAPQTPPAIDKLAQRLLNMMPRNMDNLEPVDVESREVVNG